MADMMKALVYHGVDNISLDDVPIPKIINPDCEC